jgi:glyoxylase-like metal-dependent hydrolase (beta-lactamase superfamily II)
MPTEAKEIADGVYCFRILIANVYFVRSGSGWVLIDTALPNSAAKIRAVADHLIGPGTRPASIIMTHGHLDHSGSVVDLARGWNVPAYLHPLEFPFCEGKRPYPLPDPSVGGFMALLSRFMPVTKIDLQGVPQPVEASQPVPDLPDWQSVFTPGHSPGHLSFFRASDGTLLAGDAFATANLDSLWDLLRGKQQLSRPPAPVTCDWKAARQSVVSLAALNPKVLACGHGVPMTGSDAPQLFQEFAKNFPVPAHGKYV